MSSPLVSVSPPPTEVSSFWDVNSGFFDKSGSADDENCESVLCPLVRRAKPEVGVTEPSLGKLACMPLLKSVLSLAESKNPIGEIIAVRILSETGG
jgi:hypothetical protein